MRHFTDSRTVILPNVPKCIRVLIAKLKPGSLLSPFASDIFLRYFLSVLFNIQLMNLEIRKKYIHCLRKVQPCKCFHFSVISDIWKVLDFLRFQQMSSQQLLTCVLCKFFCVMFTLYQKLCSKQFFETQMLVKL